VSNTTPLAVGRDEQLLDHDRPFFLAAQGDVAGRSTLLAGDKSHTTLQHLEYPLVAPAGQTGERALREPEQVRQVSLHPRSDLDLGCQRAPPSALMPDAGAPARAVTHPTVTSPDVQVEIVTLSLGYEPVDLPYVDAKEIRDRLVEGRVLTQELRHVLSNALDAGRGRIHENHRPELLTALEGIKSERPDHFSPALRRLYEVTQKPITP
jgi:hypothetical protein